MTDLVFWQNIISPHQAPFLEALARQYSDGDVSLICERRMSPARQAQGWSEPTLHGVVVTSMEDVDGRPAFIRAHLGKGAVHVVSGFTSIPVVKSFLRLAAAKDDRVIVLAERPAIRRRIDILKNLIYRQHASKLNRRIDGVLAYGDSGAQYYRDCGFSRVWPMAYTVGTPPTHDVGAQSVTQILFVGSDLARKDFSLLARSLCSIGDEESWHLHVVTADETSAFEQDFVSAGLETRATFHGVLPNIETRKRMSAADVLVLPSVFDGWGAVVNEALHAGARVIVSKQCGAACLVEGAPWRGQVFRAGSEEGLRTALLTELNIGPQSLAARERISQWATDAVSPEAIARYFLAIVQGHQPSPPWRAS